MGKITIYRFIESSDTISTAEKLVFNDSTKNDTTTPNGFIDKVTIHPIDGVGDNQGSEQEFGDQQALGPVLKTYVIEGRMSARATSPNSFIDTLTQWSKDNKADPPFSNGQFAYRDDDDPSDDFTPIPDGAAGTPTGLLWQDLITETDFKGNQKKFTLTLRVSVGNGT